MRPIDADKLLKMMSYWKPYMDMENVREAIKKMPTITPQSELANRLRKLDELYTKLHAVTGFTAERLLEMFVAGYTLKKPDYSKSMKELADLAEITPQNEPRMINADKLAKRIAGHNNYHGDAILAAIYCAAEGKENDNSIRPIEAPQNEWVSVEERLPPPKQNVLAYSPSSGIAEADYADGIWMQYRWSAIMHGVTHWMPLPAPPRRQENNTNGD